MNRAPFFIVGTGRSGTTLLRKLLSAHPAVHVPKETHFLPILVETFGNGRAPARAMFEVVEQMYMAKGDSVIEHICRQQPFDAAGLRERTLRELDATKDGCTVGEFMNGI